MVEIVVATTYHFVALTDCATLRLALLRKCRSRGVVGTLVLAEEGINGTIAGTREAIDGVFGWWRCDPRFADLDVRESHATELPFHRMKVIVRDEIVTMGRPGVDPTKGVGAYVEPRDWNEVLRDPGFVVLDCRNQFEVEVGTFAGAVDPQTTSFSEFPEFVETNLDPVRDRRVAMFCTGGIRCEKASSFLLDQGFATIVQLRGGILAYLEQLTEVDSMWQGECFVFDRRVTVRQGLRRGTYSECHGCKLPVSAVARRSARYEVGVTCPRCFDDVTAERRRNLRERHRQMGLAAARGGRHLGRVESDTG